MAKKTWREKYETRKESEVEVLKTPFGGLQPGQRIVISTPKEIEGMIREIPRGQSLSIKELRAQLAEHYKVDGACTITTSMFVRFIAEVTLEDLENGAKIEEVAPFWRVIDAKSPLASKISCGREWIAAARLAEGIDTGPNKSL